MGLTPLLLSDARTVPQPKSSMVQAMNSLPSLLRVRILGCRVGSVQHKHRAASVSDALYLARDVTNRK